MGHDLDATSKLGNKVERAFGRIPGMGNKLNIRREFKSRGVYIETKPERHFVIILPVSKQGSTHDRQAKNKSWDT